MVFSGLKQADILLSFDFVRKLSVKVYMSHLLTTCICEEAATHTINILHTYTTTEKHFSYETTHCIYHNIKENQKIATHVNKLSLGIWTISKHC